MDLIRRNPVAATAAPLILAMVVVATVAAEHDRGVAASQASYAGGTAHGLVSHFLTKEGGPHTLILIDQNSKRVGVYQIDPSTGQLALRSVRHVAADLQMTDFNSAGPSPEEITNALRDR